MRIKYGGPKGAELEVRKRGLRNEAAQSRRAFGIET